LASLLSFAETDASTGKPKQARQGKQKMLPAFMCAQSFALKLLPARLTISQKAKQKATSCCPFHSRHL